MTTLSYGWQCRLGMLQSNSNFEFQRLASVWIIVKQFLCKIERLRSGRKIGDLFVYFGIQNLECKISAVFR